MIRDYIEKMLLENEKRVQELGQEKKSLLNDLQCTEELLERLQKEKRMDVHIFSPRSIDPLEDEKIRDAQNEIKILKQQIAYIQETIETCMSKKMEYKSLLLEIENNIVEVGKSAINENQSQTTPEEFESQECAIEESKTQEYMVEVPETQKRSIEARQEKNVTTEDLSKSVQVNDETTVHTTESPKENNAIIEIETETVQEKKTAIESETVEEEEEFDVEEVIELLKDIFRKTEICLALVNGNKNRCKMELKEIKNMIRVYAKKIKKWDT